MKRRYKILAASFLILGYLCYRQVPEKLTLYSLDPDLVTSNAKATAGECVSRLSRLGQIGNRKLPESARDHG